MKKIKPADAGRASTSQHTAEPFDGTESDMHRCSDCRVSFKCRMYVPSMRNTPMRCQHFKEK